MKHAAFETSPSPSWWGRSLALPLALPVALTLCAAIMGCGPEGDEPQSPQLRRLALKLTDAAASWPRATAAEALDMSLLFDDEMGSASNPDHDDGPWQIGALDHHPGSLAGRQGDDGAKVVWLQNPDGSTSLQLKYHGDFAPGAFNEVRMRLLVAGAGDGVAELGRDGRVVGVGPRVQMVQGLGLRDAVFALPEHFTDRGGADTVAVTFSKTIRRVGVASVELLHRPPEAWLPDPSLGADLVNIAGDARRGVGMSTRRAVSCTVKVPDRGRLSFSYGQPYETVRSESELELLLAITDTGTSDEALLEEHFAFPQRGVAWRVADLDLSSFAGREVRMDFSLVAGDGQLSAAAVAELALWVPQRRPLSLLLITSDTHRFDHVGAAVDDNVVSTPVLDALASRGVFFERCFSTTNVTNPSHGSIMTGVHPRDTAISHNNLPLNGSALTMAEVLAEQGWVTQAVLGVHHLGHPSSGLGQGFDRIDWPMSGERDVESSLALVEQWLRQAEDRPLFLWLHLFDAHGPYKPEAAYRRLYWPDDKNPFDQSLPESSVPNGVLSEWLTGLRDHDWPLAAYRGEVSALDSSLAGLLSAPRFASGVIAVTADHGESFGAHGIWYGHAGLYPDSTHVPLIVAGEGLPRGQRVADSVSQVDLAATLLELSGVAGHGIPGQSFAALVAGASSEPSRRAATPSPCFALSAHRFSASVTSGRWHLILHLNKQHQKNMTSTFEQHQVQLFDLDNDPACDLDLSVERHDETARLRGRLIHWLAAAEDMGWVGEELDDPVRLAELRQLGYLAAPANTSTELWAADDCERCVPFGAEDP
ncbi:MAG: arylsulfatase A-like enzyme [Pseudohongiellaceae bacterium]